LNLSYEKKRILYAQSDLFLYKNSRFEWKSSEEKIKIHLKRISLAIKFFLSKRKENIFA